MRPTFGDVGDLTSCRSKGQRKGVPLGSGTPLVTSLFRTA